MTSATAVDGRAPAAWLLEMMRLKPARVPVGHTIRAGLAVGLPFIVGSLLDQTLNGMWVGLATLLLAAGEREGTYRLNFQIIAVSTPIAAAGYLLGFAHGLPLGALILLTGLLAFLAGAMAGLGPAFSVAGMQFLLVAAIAIGVPGVDWWRPLWLYFVGGAFYAVLLAVEMVINPRRPERIVLVDLLQSLADLAGARSADLREGTEHTGPARQAATTAYQKAVARLSEISARPSGSSTAWVMDSDVLSAADRVQAFLVGETDPAAAAAAATRLSAMADGIGEEGRSREDPAGPDATVPGLLGDRIDELAVLLHSGGRDPAAPRHRLITPSIGAEVLLAACRLALCYAIAVAAKDYFPFNHWFWVPLTVCLVMKPDFGSVFSRAVLRVIGTAVGAAIATVIILLVPKGWAMGLAIGLLSACVPYFMMRSYALQAVAIAPAVILLVDVIAPGEDTANYSLQRIGATVVGGLVVLVFGYLIWPHTRRGWITETFAGAMNRIADQLRLAAAPIPVDRVAAATRHDELVAARRGSYRSLSDLQVRLKRALSEPGEAGRVAAAWIPAATGAARLADTVTAYAVVRRAGTAIADPAAGTALAARIEELGGSSGPPRPADRPGIDAAAVGASAPDLAAVAREVTRLSDLVETARPTT